MLELADFLLLLLRTRSAVNTVRTAEARQKWVEQTSMCPCNHAEKEATITVIWRTWAEGRTWAAHNTGDAKSALQICTEPPFINKGGGG